MFMSLFIIFFVGISVGFLFEKVHIPKIIWYLILGVLMSSSVLGLIDDTLYSVSSYIRQIALVIILTRSGLSLDLKKLKTIGRSAILMCFQNRSLKAYKNLLTNKLYNKYKLL